MKVVNLIDWLKRPHGKGKFLSKDNTKIGIKVDNSSEKMKRTSDERPMASVSVETSLLIFHMFFYMHLSSGNTLFF